ncbi:MAG: hypothetical protein AB1805_00630 [Nitrospirota bacterium]
MDKKEQEPRKKNPCPDCTFCQCCSESRCALCRPPGDKKKKREQRPKVHRPLFRSS